jgi:signal transduction histidine kinase
VVGDVFFHAVDVTEQVRARQHVEQLARELQAERDRLRKVVELLPTAVLVTDTALTIQVGNRAARMLLGVDGAAPAPPVAAGETIPADDVGIFAAYEVRRLDGTPYEAAELPLTRALRQGEEVRGEQMLLRHSDGHDVPILTSAAPLYDETGAITSAVLVFQEITAIRELEQAREEFLSSAAHDLRTPLTSIQGLAELARWRLNRLGMDNLGPIAAHMEGIEAASSRMARLIDSLADISRARLGAAFELESSHVDLVTLVETVVTRFAEQGTHRVNFITEVPTLPITLDALRFERVVDNLVSNAIKYSSSGGEINVRVAREEAGTEPSAIVEVEDHGIGIGAADQARIFERFHRAAGVRGHIPGSGVGLASVMQIIRQLGGTIKVRSHEGEGSTFTVRLPLEVETGDSSALHRGE